MSVPPDLGAFRTAALPVIPAKAGIQEHWLYQASDDVCASSEHAVFLGPGFRRDDVLALACFK